jgi:hypothetical protein
MSNIPTEYYQPKSSKEIALQRLAAGRQEIMLLTHLLQASLVVERKNPLRQAMIAHPHLVRNVTIAIVILLSIALGVLAPEISRSLRPY